jgi:hypothetical protein
LSATDRKAGKQRRAERLVAQLPAFGSFIGGRLLGLVSSTILLPLLAVILVLSAVKVWKHQ